MSTRWAASRAGLASPYRRWSAMDVPSDRSSLTSTIWSCAFITAVLVAVVMRYRRVLRRLFLGLLRGLLRRGIFYYIHKNMYAVETSSYYLLAVATILVNVAALGVAAVQYQQAPTSGALSAVVLGAFAAVWGIMALAVVGSAAAKRSSKRFGTASVLVLLTAIVSLGAAIAAGYGVVATGSVYQGVGVSLFTVLIVMYLALSFVVSEAMLQAQRGGRRSR